jgi:carboxyl-terminal processing protease
MTLTHNQRKRILNAIRERVLRNHFNVSGVNYDDWLRSLERRSPELLAVDVQDFEAGIQDLLHELRSSHTGFFHDRPNRLLPQHTINATFGKVEDSKPLWFILDVFEEGPAQRAGLNPGDVLQRVDGVEYTAPNMPPLGREERTYFPFLLRTERRLVTFRSRCQAGRGTKTCLRFCLQRAYRVL